MTVDHHRLSRMAHRKARLLSVCPMIPPLPHNFRFDMPEPMLSEHTAEIVKIIAKREKFRRLHRDVARSVLVMLPETWRPWHGDLEELKRRLAWAREPEHDPEERARFYVEKQVAELRDARLAKMKADPGFVRLRPDLFRGLS